MYVQSIWKAIFAYTGETPTGCPWAAFKDPIVADTLSAYGFWTTGQLDQFWTQDPPYLLIDAIGFYAQTIERITGKQAELARKNRE